MANEFSYYEINKLLWRWRKKESARIVREARLSMDRAPPVLPKRPEPKTPPTPPPNRTANTINGVMDIFEAPGRFKKWLDSPDPPKPPKAPPAKKNYMAVPPFDIQQIPSAMRKEDMPVAARLMERWFAGALNYSPTDDDEKQEINQDGKPYPKSMIDLTIIKMGWVLKFERARQQYDELITHAIYSPKAKHQVTDILSRYRNRPDRNSPWILCEFDLMKLHRNFQFQRVGVESTIEQKAMQAIRRIPNAEVPDDLTGALGSFVLYAAITGVEYDLRRESAKVTHIVVYVKDHYTFDGEEGSKSQYLGHWSKNGVIVVPAFEAANLAGTSWLDYPVAVGDVHKEGNTYYPVRNNSFREWQLRHQRGGDFIVLSDYKPIRLDHPIEVFLS
jgi:hypothetical protein